MCTFTYSTWQVSCTSYMICVLLMLFSVCFGVTMFGEPWLRPPALWNQLRATRPGPAARKIIMKPMIFTISMAFWHKKKHNPNNLTRKHKENHYNWQFQLISMGGIEQNNTLSADFSSGKTGGKAQNLPQWPHAHAKLSGWVHYLASWWTIFSRDQPAGWWPPILVLKSKGNLPNNGPKPFSLFFFLGNRVMTAQQSLIFTDFKITLGTLKKFGSATSKKNEKQFGNPLEIGILANDLRFNQILGGFFSFE